MSGWGIDIVWWWTALWTSEEHIESILEVEIKKRKRKHTL
jgi:hypothetical protein